MIKNNVLTDAIRQQKIHNHVCGFYADKEERLDMLASYYKVGLERGELCVFVTEQDPEELIYDLRRHGLYIRGAVKRKQFRILPMQSTYLPNGSFKSAEMLNNLREFVRYAMANGYPGVRGGGDMEWLALRPPGWEEAGGYEAKINRFIRTSNFTGLCLFPMGVLDQELTQQIIQAHQKMLRGGKLHSNPYYQPPEKSFKFDLDIIAHMESWLDSLDREETSKVTA